MLHTAVQQITNLHLKWLPCAAYSSDLTLSDYLVFVPLKEMLGEKKFSTIKEIKEAKHSWLQGQSEVFFFLKNQALQPALNVMETILKTKEEFSVIYFIQTKRNN